MSPLRETENSSFSGSFGVFPHTLSPLLHESVDSMSSSCFSSFIHFIISDLLSLILVRLYN